MSQTATNFVRDLRGINSGERVVLYAIASHINNGTLEGFPSFLTIAAESSLHESSVKRIVKLLESKGILLVSHSKGGSHRTGVNHYRLNTDYQSVSSGGDSMGTNSETPGVSLGTQTGTNSESPGVSLRKQRGLIIETVKALKEKERYTQREPPPFPPEGDAGEVLVCGAPGDDVGILDDSPARLPDPPQAHLPQAGWAGAHAQPQISLIDYSKWRKPGK
jgi:hypothetical protein